MTNQVACEGNRVESRAGDHDRRMFPKRNLWNITFHNYCHYIDFLSIMKRLGLIHVPEDEMHLLLTCM